MRRVEAIRHQFVPLSRVLVGRPGRRAKASMLAYSFLLCSLVMALGAVGGSGRPGERQWAHVQDPVSRTPTIRVSSHLVVVPVAVTDLAGRSVGGLRAEDFRVEENGVEVATSGLGEPGELPLELALLFDISGSVNRRFDFEQQAASRFLKAILRPRDKVVLVTIESAPRVLCQGTSSFETALQALQTLRPTDDTTAFYDAVVLGAHSFSPVTTGTARRVLVALSDGEDNSSESHRARDALYAVQEADCVFYSINPGGHSIQINRMSLAGQKEMETLASETGGMAFLADELQQLDGIFSRISAEIRAQYLLGYYSPAPGVDGTFRRIRVQVPSRPELRIRARQGYYAVNPRH